jgi:Ca2+/H+ antiporter
MQTLKSESLILIAIAMLGVGLAFEHTAVEHGGAMLWGLLGLILAAIIGVAFRIAHHAEVLALRLGEPYGTLILTIAAVSVVVVILVVLLQGAPSTATRNTTSIRPTRSSPCCWSRLASACSFQISCRIRNGRLTRRFPSASWR